MRFGTGPPPPVRSVGAPGRPGYVGPVVRHFWRWIGAIVGAGFALRLALLVTIHWGTEPGFNDSPYYSAQARDLLRGTLFRDPATGGPGAEHGPVTSVLLAPLSWGPSPADTQRVGTLLIGSATIVVLALVARRFGGDRAGVIAAGIAAVYPNLWLNDGLVMSEAPGAALVAAWLLTGARWRDRPGWGRAAAWGAVGGIATLTRSELALLVLAAAVIVVVVEGRPALRGAAVVLAVAGLVVSPWVVWNLVRFDRPVAMTTNDGTTLRGANCPDTYSGREMGSWSVHCLVLDGGATADLETAERSAEWRRQGLEYARDNADRLPVVLAARAGRLLDVYGVGHQVDEDVRDDRPRWGSRAGVVAWWVLLPLAVIGAVRAPRSTRWILVSPAGVVVVTSLLFYAGHRIRSPAEPAVVVAAALALSGLWTRRTSGRPRP